MKKLILISLSILLLNCDKKINDRHRRNLFGKVKSVTHSSFEAIYKFGEVLKGKKIPNPSFFNQNFFVKFNNFGNEIELIEWELNGSIKQHSFAKYDKENRLKQVITNDSKGKLIYRLDFLNGKNNKPSDKFIYDSKGNLEGTNKFIYNKNDLIVESIYYNSEGKEEGKIKNKYDEKNNLIELIYIDKDNEASHHKRTFKFNSKNFNTEINEFDWEGSLEMKYIYDYDSHGNVIEDYKYKSDGSLYEKRTYEYSFDEKGNWIKKVITKNDKPEFVIFREIEYY